MMMERVKTAPAPEEPAKPTSAPSSGTTSSKPAPATSLERMAELERRLNDLDTTMAEVTDAVKPAAVAATKPVAGEVKQQPAVGAGKSNPLLARIMAAQERAKLAEQKEKEAKAAAAQAEAERQKSQEEAATAAAKLKELQMQIQQAQMQQQNQQQQQQHQQAQVQQQQPQQQQQHQKQSQSAKEKRDQILRELEGMDSPIPTQAIPIMKSMDTPPPPPFDPMGLVDPRPQQQHQEQHELEQKSSQQLSPPSFEVMEQMMNTTTISAPAPSAPPASPALDHLAGVLPMPAPIDVNHSLPPPPSFAEFESQMQQQTQSTTAQVETDAFDFDVDGVPLSAEERQQMLEEQRQLYENIMKEKAANDEAIARASADAFDSRSAAAAAKAEERIEQMDSMGRDLDQRANRTGGPKTEGEETENVNEPRRYVKIGNNQTVALHGQERTKKAIKEGTALLVQCINCQNWMQVTATATLMFCPVCQVVCPVVKQSEVQTKEEAIQLTMDRKLAEKLQAEAYVADDKKPSESSYLSRLFGSGEASTTAASAAPVASSSSWWDKLTSIVSYGVEEESRPRGEMGVTRPPSSATNSSISTYPAQRRPVPSLTPATITETQSRANEETQGLLHPVIVNGNEANLPSGRVSEQRPLLSCVYDSVSSAASAVFSNDGSVDEEGNVYGVDSRSLLAVTEREEDEEGEASGSRTREIL